MQRPRREYIPGGSPWEPVVGYSRAVKVGNSVYVAGTTGIDAQGRVVGVGDPYTQTVQALKTIERILRQAGASMKDVVRTRIFVTDIGHWERVGKAHAEFFSTVRPAATLVEVRRLILPELLVEIEVDAVIMDDTGT